MRFASQRRSERRALAVGAVLLVILAVAGSCQQGRLATIKAARGSMLAVAESISGAQRQIRDGFAAVSGLRPADPAEEPVLDEARESFRDAYDELDRSRLGLLRLARGVPPSLAPSSIEAPRSPAILLAVGAIVGGAGVVIVRGIARRRNGTTAQRPDN